MVHTYQEYDSLLKAKDALISGQRHLLEAKEELTQYIDSAGASDGSTAGSQDAVQCLRKAINYLTDGVTWTGQAAGNAKLTLDTLLKNLLALAEYIRSTAGGLIEEQQEKVENLQKQIAETAADMDLGGTIEMYGRATFLGEMRRYAHPRIHCMQNAGKLSSSHRRKARNPAICRRNLKQA